MVSILVQSYYLRFNVIPQYKLNEEIRTLGDYRFHLECFKCTTCHALLETGMRFGTSEHGQLFCEPHFEDMKNVSKVGLDQLQFLNWKPGVIQCNHMQLL